MRPAPVLYVTTEVIDDPGELMQYTLARHPTAFLRNGDGIVGYGDATSFHDAGGGGRLHRIAEWWRGLSAAAIIDDPVGLAGTGLVAFGSFAFSDASGAPSILRVPAIVIGRRDGMSWRTRISVDPWHGFDPEIQSFGPEFHAQLAPGAMTGERYTDAVATAVTRIADGAASKVVLARDLVGTGTKMADLRTVLRRLATAYPDTFTFAVGGLLGSSPETLVRVENGRVSARVLAGSAARGADAAADALARQTLSDSSKDRSEHAFARESLLTALAPHAADLTTTEFALELPNLWHLATDVSGALTDESSSLDLVAALHPTAAVAGAPTASALKLIAELEPFDRGRYAGPVGWVDARGDGEWAVALRCAQFTDTDGVTAYAGAGIVADSDPARELAETELKFRPIVEALK